MKKLRKVFVFDGWLRGGNGYVYHYDTEPWGDQIIDKMADIAMALPLAIIGLAMIGTVLAAMVLAILQAAGVIS